MNVSAKLFGNVFGAVYVAIGLIGFALTGFDGLAATEGPTLIVFEINPLHNLVHVLIGMALLAAAATGERIARTTSGVIAVTYALVGVVGFAVIGTAVNILALNVADNLLHLATAGAAFAVIAAAREPAAAEL
jgi:hypothetical protein